LNFWGFLIGTLAVLTAVFLLLGRGEGIAQRLLDWLNRSYDTNIRVERLEWKFPASVTAYGVYIPDHHDDTLFYARRLETGLTRLLGIGKNQWHFRPSRVEDGRVYVTLYEGEKDDSWTVFFQKFNKNKSKKKQSSSLRMRIRSVDWNGGKVVVDNRRSSGTVYFMKDLHFSAAPFEMKGKDIFVDLRQANFEDYYGWQVRDLSAKFYYWPDSMAFRGLELQTDTTRLRGDLRFIADQGWSPFFDRVEIKGRLKGQIGGYDVNKISGDLVNGKEIMDVDTQLDGVFNELELNDLKFKVRQSTLQYTGDLVVYEMGSDAPMGVVTDGRLIWDYPSLQKFLPRITRTYVPEMLSRAGRVQLDGTFKHLDNVTAGNWHIQSDAGKTKTRFDIRWEKEPRYRFYVETGGLDAGRLTANPSLGEVAGVFEAEGISFEPARMKTRIHSEISKVVYNAYPYRNILWNGNIDRGMLTSRLRAEDKALRMLLDGKIGLTGEKIWDFSTQVYEWDLHKTGWVKSDTLALLTFSSTMNMQGNTLDDLTGTLGIHDLQYQRTGHEYHLKNMTVKSFYEDDEKVIDITSDKAVNGFLRGNFSISRLQYLPKKILGVVFPGFQTHEARDTLQPAQNIRFKLLFDTNLLHILDPSVKYTKNTLIKGRISDKDEYVHTEMHSDEFVYGGVTFYQSHLTIDNRNPIYNMYIQADSITSGVYSFSKLQAINLTIRDTTYLKLKSRGGTGGNDRWNITAAYVLDSVGNTFFKFLTSTMDINGKRWTIDPERYANIIRYFPARDSLAVREWTVFHENELWQLDGYDTPENRDLQLLAENIHLEDWLNFGEGLRFAGLLNARATSEKTKGVPFYNAAARIDGLRWNDVPLGDVTADIRTLSSEAVFVDLVSVLDGINLFSAKGFADIPGQEINFHVTTAGFPLSPLNELLKDVFSNFRGTLTGHTAITGKWDKPMFDGTMSLYGAGLTVNELNVDYAFENNEQIFIREQKIVFDSNAFHDTKYNTRGTLDGEMYFYNFTNWKFDLGITTSNLLVLDTPYSDEALYYGTAFVEGQSTISGFINKLKIDASVKSNPNTQIFIPLRDVETIGDDHFIRFYTETEYAKKKKNGTRQTRIYEGLELNLDIDITEDAEIEIVLDQEFGSTLKSRGEGNILMEINTEGKFNMWGAYEVTEGKYNFRYAGVIDKEFTVEPGSTLIWNGDPFRAELDIKAVYFIPAADISPLLTEAVPYTTRIPVKVIIYIKGDLMKPRIDFDVELPEASPVIRSEVEYALRDPDMRMLQVISLLYSGNFISPNVLKFDNRTAVEGNLSERVLSVFNSLLENDIFNVKLDYVPDRQDPRTNVKTDPRVGLTIQTKINKRIYINGKLAMPVGRYTKSSVSGDIEAAIWLNDDGTLQLRIYNKRTEIEFVDQEESYTRGIGISFQVDFDTFRELARKLGIDIKAEN